MQNSIYIYQRLLLPLTASFTYQNELYSTFIQSKKSISGVTKVCSAPLPSLQQEFMKHLFFLVLNNPPSLLFHPTTPSTKPTIQAWKPPFPNPFSNAKCCCVWILRLRKLKTTKYVLWNVNWNSTSQKSLWDTWQWHFTT